MLQRRYQFQLTSLISRLFAPSSYRQSLIAVRFSLLFRAEAPRQYLPDLLSGLSKRFCLRASIGLPCFSGNYEMQSRGKFAALRTGLDSGRKYSKVTFQSSFMRAKRMRQESGYWTKQRGHLPREERCISWEQDRVIRSF